MRIVFGSFAAALALAVSPASAADFVIAPGQGPAEGYLPLSVFGISARAPGADKYVTVSTPPINFAGQVWSSVNIGQNGLVTFGDLAASGSIWTAANKALPSSGYKTAIAAPLWADVDLTGGGLYVSTLSDGVSSWFVADWHNVLIGGTRSSFEVWLGIDRDDTTFSYGALGTPLSATIGAQDSTGTVGATYVSGSTTELPALSELRVTSVGLPVASVPEPATWLLMIVGMGLTGMAMRRRRATAWRIITWTAT